MQAVLIKYKLKYKKVGLYSVRKARSYVLGEDPQRSSGMLAGVGEGGGRGFRPPVKIFRGCQKQNVLVMTQECFSDYEELN